MYYSPSVSTPPLDSCIKVRGLQIHEHRKGRSPYSKGNEWASEVSTPEYPSASGPLGPVCEGSYQTSLIEISSTKNIEACHIIDIVTRKLCAGQR